MPMPLPSPFDPIPANTWMFSIILLSIKALGVPYCKNIPLFWAYWILLPVRVKSGTVTAVRAFSPEYSIVQSFITIDLATLREIPDLFAPEKHKFWTTTYLTLILLVNKLSIDPTLIFKEEGRSFWSPTYRYTTPSS